MQLHFDSIAIGLRAIGAERWAFAPAPPREIIDHTLLNPQINPHRAFVTLGLPG
jgi:hypothetical protein